MSEPAACAGGSAPQRPRVLLALIVGQLGLHSAMAGLRMAAPLQLLREGAGAWLVGLLLALFAAAPMLFALRAGRLADRLGYHRPVHLAIGLTAAGMAMAVAAAAAELGGARQLLLLCAAAALTGAGTNLGMLTIQRAAALAAADGAERVRIFSWLGVAPPLANVIGPVAAGFAIDLAGFAWAYALLALMPLATVLATRQVPRSVAPGVDAADARANALDLLRAPGMKRLLLVNWLLATCWDVHAFAVPILGHERGFSASTIGLVLGAFTFAVGAVRAALPLIAHRVREAEVIRGAMIGTGAVLLVYPLARTPGVMGLCALLLGATLGVAQPMIMSTLHHLTPAQRHGEALAFRSMAINTSSVLMPLVFGAAGAALGAAVLFWVVGGAVGAGSIVARRLNAALR